MEFFLFIKINKKYCGFNFEICFDLQNSSRTNFYRKNLKIQKNGLLHLRFCKKVKQKQFDQDGVIERFKVQLDRSNINDTSHVLKPDFSWAIEESFSNQRAKIYFFSSF